MNHSENQSTFVNRLTVAIGRELRPSQLFASLSASFVTGLLEIVMCISFAALIFSGLLAPFLPNALGFFLATGVISVAIHALFTSFPGVVGGPQDIPAAILAVAALSVRSHLIATSATSQEIFLTLMATIALTAVTTGLFLWGLGQFKLGGLVRFLPYPVIGGFLAGTGWLLATGAISTMTNQPFSAMSLQPDQLIRWLPGLLFALCLMAVLRRTQHSLVIPATLAGSTVLFFGMASLLRTSPTELSAAGWLIGPFPSGNLWHALSLSDLALVRWTAIGGQVLNIVTIIIMSAVALLLNATGLEIATRQDINLNHELKVAGIANLFSGLAGGSVGFHQMSASMISHKMGVNNRLAGLFTAVICAIALFFGASALALFPKAVLGGLVLFLGLSMLKEWVVDAWFSLPKVDYAVVVMILLVTAVIGFLEAVGVGLIATIFLFVINYSRIDVVRHELTGATQQSRVTRPPRQQERLIAHGEQIYILRLQGFIFFGTADNLVNKVRARVEDKSRPPVRYLILDFRRVTAIDSTAGLSFRKLQQLAESKTLTLICTEMSAKIQQQLEKNGLAENPRCLIYPDLDRGLAWCEEQILGTGDDSTTNGHHLAQQLLQLLPDQRKIERLLPHLTRLELPAGYYLIQQNDPPDALYFVESGQVTAQLEFPNQKPIRLQTMRGGHVVGEIGFYRQQVRTAAVITDEPSVIYQLTLAKMQQMEVEDSEAASVLHQIIVQLLAARVTHLVDAVNALQR